MALRALLQRFRRLLAEKVRQKRGICGFTTWVTACGWDVVASCVDDGIPGLLSRPEAGADEVATLWRKRVTGGGFLLCVSAEFAHRGSGGGRLDACGKHFRDEAFVGLIERGRRRRRCMSSWVADVAASIVAVRGRSCGMRRFHVSGDRRLNMARRVLSIVVQQRDGGVMAGSRIIPRRGRN